MIWLQGIFYPIAKYVAIQYHAIQYHAYLQQESVAPSIMQATFM